MTITTIDPASDSAWLAILDHRHAGLFHSPPWLRAISDGLGLDIRAVIARDADGTVTGGLPFCQIDDCAGRRIVSLPFSESCDMLARTPAVAEGLYRGLQSHGIPVQLRCLTDGTWSPDDMTVTRRARWHRVATAPSAEAAWIRLTESTRRAIRKARKAGVEIRALETDDELDSFHALLVSLRKRKYRLLTQPRAFFDRLAHHFRAADGWFPLGLFHQGRLVAATIYLRWRDALHYKFNASDADFLQLRPNNLLMWAGLDLARTLGCRVLDLGASDDDQAGLIRFKRGFGAVEDEVRFLRWQPSDWLEAPGAEGRRALVQLSRLLTAPDVPDDVSGRAGAEIYRFFA